MERSIWRVTLWGRTAGAGDHAVSDVVATAPHLESGGDVDPGEHATKSLCCQGLRARPTAVATSLWRCTVRPSAHGGGSRRMVQDRRMPGASLSRLPSARPPGRATASAFGGAAW
jgi:hypothetical protein